MFEGLEENVFSKKCLKIVKREFDLDRSGKWKYPVIQILKEEGNVTIDEMIRLLWEEVYRNEEIRMM